MLVRGVKLLEYDGVATHSCPSEPVFASLNVAQRLVVRRQLVFHTLFPNGRQPKHSWGGVSVIHDIEPCSPEAAPNCAPYI